MATACHRGLLLISVICSYLVNEVLGKSVSGIVKRFGIHIFHEIEPISDWNVYEINPNAKIEPSISHLFRSVFPQYDQIEFELSRFSIRERLIL